MSSLLSTHITPYICKGTYTAATTLVDFVTCDASYVLMIAFITAPPGERLFLFTNGPSKT